MRNVDDDGGKDLRYAPSASASGEKKRDTGPSEVDRGGIEHAEHPETGPRSRGRKRSFIHLVERRKKGQGYLNRRKKKLLGR